MKCPICDKEITNHYTDYMEHILTEEYRKCEDESHFYVYEYYAGNTKISIGDFIIMQSYIDSITDKIDKNKIYLMIKKLERKRYKENNIKMEHKHARENYHEDEWD